MESMRAPAAILDREDQSKTVKPEPDVSHNGTAECSDDQPEANEDREQSPTENKDTRKELGARGEAVACLYLERQGIEILERNWRCKAGEADIIAREDDEIVFIEVKTRASLSAGLPEDSVTRQKRRKYEGIAIYYLARADAPSSKVRFDVISITLVNAGRAFLRHHRDAFSTGD